MKYSFLYLILTCLFICGCSSIHYSEQVDIRKYLQEQRHDVTQPGSDRTITLNRGFVLKRSQSEEPQNDDTFTLKSGVYRHIGSNEHYLFFKADIDGLWEVKREGKVISSQRVDWGLAVSSTSKSPTFVYSPWGPKLAMEMWKINVEDFSYTGDPTWNRNF